MKNYFPEFKTKIHMCTSNHIIKTTNQHLQFIKIMSNGKYTPHGEPPCSQQNVYYNVCVYRPCANLYSLQGLTLVPHFLKLKL